jgi:diamine N-acetyltransferase
MKVRIRPLRRKDAYTSVEWRNIPELWVHTTFKASHEITIENELEWIEKVISDPRSARFAILADEVYVGNIYLTNIEDGVGEYHIFIGDRAYWGKGVARKASVEIIEHAKGTLNLSEIILGVSADNAGALHLYRSLGFVDDGLREDGFLAMKLDLSKWDGDPRDKIK